MCDEAFLENCGTLKSVSDCYKNKKMCNKAVDNYPHTLEFVPECCKTEEMCDEAVHKCFFFLFDSIPNQYKTQEICGIVVSLYLFLIAYCPDKYII